MINTWFTSDSHFGHKNILEYEPEARPFKTVEEMNETLIDRWNSVVRPNDIVYHLGDFCFGRKNIEIARRLQGKIRLVMGNHDTYPIGDYLNYFDKVYGAFHWKKCILTHIPVHEKSLGSRFFLNVHGHLHSNAVIYNKNDDDGVWRMRVDENYFNVSVERHNLTPVHADIILKKVEELDN